LTVDIKLQRAAERALTYGIGVARSSAEGAYADGGAIVAMDPRDGSILALASNPTYQPSIFAGQKDKAKLAPLLDPTAAQKANYPALNRAIDVGYPPGSTFKPVTALAAMQERLLTPYQLLHCTPTYTAYKQEFHNWTPDISQWMDLRTALAESCDTFFYQLGDAFYRLPPNRGHPLQAWANRFGLGEQTGLDIGPEASGLIPTPEWRRATFSAKKGYGILDRTWKPGYSIQLAIGQGDVLVTPLQMARFYALIANGGNLVTPHLLMDVENPNGTAVPIPGRPAPKPVDIDPQALSVVRQGLWEGTHLSFGTSYPVFGQFPVSIAGKTGTAEKVVTLPGYTGLKNQSWWCGYGPTDKPTLVVCAVIENGGHGGTAAAPAAAEVFAKYFHVNVKPATSKHSD
jgi:penicillin-binding protein 2